MVKLSVFCAGWLLPVCIPASVGLSILGVGVACAVESRLPLHSWATEFSPQADRIIHGEVGSHPLAQRGLGALCLYSAWSKSSPQPTSQKGKLRQREGE